MNEEGNTTTTKRKRRWKERSSFTVLVRSCDVGGKGLKCRDKTRGEILRNAKRSKKPRFGSIP